MNRLQRVESLKKRIRKKILVLDGATGTALQNVNLSADDFGGEEYEGCNENLVLTQPDIILDVHRQYLKAGADIVETNTFGGTPLVLDEYNLGHRTNEINKIAAELARQACEEFESDEWPRYVAGSIGPTTKSLSVTGGVDFDTLVNNFYIQARALYEGGVDYFLIETCQDTLNIKACLVAIDRLHSEVSVPLPLAVSGTIEPMGTMLAGQAVDALATSLEHRELLYLGINCATGPEFMTDHIRTLSEQAQCPISCVPNAGLPDEDGHYLETPEMMKIVLKRFAEKGWLNVIGGCCGTHSDHISAFRQLADEIKPRIMKAFKSKNEDGNFYSSRLSGIEQLEITDEMRPILVGERTNVIGSRKFKELVINEEWERGAEIARGQVKGGAAIIDICLANPDRDELQDMNRFLPEVVKKVKVPIMIDSTDPEVISAALKHIQGKAIINSINLEDGEERLELVIPLAKQYGAALVVGTIDDDPVQGMGVSRGRKIEIAQREFKVLTEKYGIASEDIYWDPLVFPCGTGDEQYVGSAPETIAAITELKEIFPGTKTVLGISNISFGLPNNGREVLNSVYLYHCVQAGLDLAIVNSQKLHRFATLSKEEVRVCEDLLWNRGDDPIAAFAAFFRKAEKKENVQRKEMSLDKRLSHYIIEGSKEGLKEDIELKLKELSPMEIINGPLMKGMDRVGELFNRNELIVAEVLQSAEAMKAAVEQLEPLMGESESSLRGTMVLATVKGDVHDIGKNLVEIILSNNGFKVINLGIKIPSEQLIEAVRKYQPDILGLSGLLVKSAQQMEISAGDLKEAGIDVPILVGGAALSRNFTYKRIAKAYGVGFVEYASDAMNGLDLAKKIVDEESGQEFKKKVYEAQRKLQEENVEKKSNSIVEGQNRSAQVSILSSIPKVPDLNRHIINNHSLDMIWSYVNDIVLYHRHLGLPAKLVKAFSRGGLKSIEGLEGESKLIEITRVVDGIKNELKNHSFFKPRAVYQFFKAVSEGNRLLIFSKETTDFNETPICEFTFPRQKKDNGLCLSDYTLPRVVANERKEFDYVAFFTVTAGSGIREWANELKDSGHFLKSHTLAALALETAEAYAEMLHGQLRNQWGFPDSIDMTLMEKFQGKYQGCRYSFGYPACPRLEDQEKLWSLIDPKEIGVELTDGFMMEPEASVSALVFHHSFAKYFSVGS